MIYEAMTWREIRNMPKEDKIVLFPLGSIEQHGFHLPLGVDTMLARAVSSELESRMQEQILLLPVQWIGHSPHHMQYDGTLSVPHQLYADLIEQTVGSLLQAGFSRIVLLNGHGGNGLPMQMALQSLKNSSPSGVHIYALHYWSPAAPDITRMRESGIGGMGHACELETSLMLHLHPELVDQSTAARDGTQPALSRIRLDMFQSAPIMQVYNFDELTGSGTFGDPTLATAAKGEAFFEVILRELTEIMQDLAAR